LTTSDREVVAALSEAIAQRIGEPRYQLWFANKTKFTWQDDQLVVGVANHFVKEWLEKKFLDDVAAAANTVLGQPHKVRFAIDPQLFQAARENQVQLGALGNTADSCAAAEGLTADTPSPTRPRSKVISEDRRSSRNERRWRQLADFVVGQCNRVAHASAVSVVEAPMAASNPLVLHGPVGTGKTHLLEGIYAGLRKQYPDWRVCYVTSEEFTNRFVQSMRTNKLGSFRKYFRDCDAFLVDDLQFLATKRATQEEFLHTFDALSVHAKPLVFSCDGHPRLAGEFSPELTDRLLGGAVWGLEPPDLETRRGILRLRSGRMGVLLPEEVLVQLADLVRGNVRELEGALHSVVHYSRVSGRSPDVQLVREALADRLRHCARVTRLEDVDRAVCHVLRLEAGALQSKRRDWSISHSRMLAMFLCRKHTSAAYSAIGHYFGGLNHSSVVAAEKKLRRWLEENSPLALGERRPPAREVVELVERELSR
jgi:chromosomal replication initiator protein